jgi:hypothetical protein
MLSDTARQALERIIALKELTETAKVQTYKSQSEILKSLNHVDLAEVALALRASKNGGGR